GWLASVLDRIRVVVCLVALTTGQFLATDRPGFLLLATGLVFLALFGYVNGAETDKARAALAGPHTRDEALLDAVGRPGALTARLRAALHRRRIRMNLVSGIEFEMAVLVVAPLLMALTGPTALFWVAGVAAGLLLLFEAALLARFWLATRVARRVTPAVAPPAGPADSPASDPAGGPVAAAAGGPADNAATAPAGGPVVAQGGPSPAETTEPLRR